MNQEALMTYAVAGGIVFAAMKYGNSMVKTGAIGIAALIVAKQIPYVKEVI